MSITVEMFHFTFANYLQNLNIITNKFTILYKKAQEYNMLYP